MQVKFAAHLPCRSFPGSFSYLSSPRLFFLFVIPGLFLFFVIPGLRPGDPYFKAQSHSQPPPEQRGPWNTVLSVRRAPAEQVIPGLEVDSW